MRQLRDGKTSVSVKNNKISCFSAVLHKKSRMLALLTLCFMMAAAFMLSGCGHKHSFVYTVDKEPTCTEDGYGVSVCECGESEGGNAIPALGHDFVNGVCSRCSLKQLFTIRDLQFTVAGERVSGYNTEVYGDGFQVSVLINGGEDISGYASPYIEWGFKGDAYGSSVTEEGVVTVAEFLGTVTLTVTVESENKVYSELPVTVVPGEGLVLQSLTVTPVEGFSQVYREGDVFNRNSITVWGEHEKGVIPIYGFESTRSPLTADMTDVVISYGELVTDIPVAVEHPTLLSIEIVSAPAKTEYLEGQSFLRDGLTVKAVYDSRAELITDFDVDEVTPLALGTDGVTVSYTFNGVTAKAVQPVTVIPRKLLSVSADTSSVRKIYTQGDVFDPSGLKVTAYYEDFEEAVEHPFLFDESVLTSDVTSVTVTYQGVDGEVTEEIPVTVVKPYASISQVKVLFPADVSISWSYSYLTDGGERRVDNTAYEENGLRYDAASGIYDIPMGAEVTATVINPAVISLTLNGEVRYVSYKEKTVSWVMGNSEIVVVNSTEMGGSHLVIRFVGQDAEQSFLYSGIWDGYLPKDDLSMLALVFADTAEYRYFYLVDGEEVTLEELGGIRFSGSKTVTVLKNAVAPDSVELTLHIGGGVTRTVSVKKNATVDELPVYAALGYVFDGWSLTENGERITDGELTALLSSEEGARSLFARMKKETVDYSDRYLVDRDENSELVMIKLVGTWRYTVAEGEESLTVTVVFNADGTFDYQVTVNGAVNCRYRGEYRLDDNGNIIVISVTTDMDITVVSAEELGLATDGLDVLVNIIVIEDDTVIFAPCVTEKVTGE
ncbi:MAG: hypothetical protein IJY04_08070 [Clostridia bacterium]|nr:hypothetical protein [Clostridia bacterium]